MGARLKGLTSGLVGVVIFAGIIIVPVLIIGGAAAVGAWALPFLNKAAGYALLAVPLLLIMAVVPPLRGLAGNGFVLASFLFGAIIWIWSLLFVLYKWGWIGVIIGIMMAGVGVVPLAILAGVFSGEWSIVLQLIIGVPLIFAFRLLGFFLIGKAEERKEEQMAAGATHV